MSTVVSSEIGDERRAYTEDDLPLSLGGSACHLALTDLADDGPVAYLGHDRGEIFIQPAEIRANEVPVTCNGVPLTASRWLGDRDEIGVGNQRLRCEIDGGTLRLVLARAVPPSGTPPVADVPRTRQDSSADRLIRPVDFEPRWQSPPRRTRFSIRTRSMVLMAAVAILFVGAWFVLTAQAVRVETTPVADHLELQGGWLTPKIGGSYLLQPGDYIVAARLEGYRTLSEVLEVNGNTPSLVSFVFEPLGGLLTITSSPVEGAEITIDGEPSGVTPARDIEVGAGEHTVKIVAPLHLPFQTTVVFEPGDPPRELSADLIPNWAPLTVASVPPGATVLLDGSSVGMTPLDYPVEAGARVVEIRRQGFKPFQQRLQATAGESVDLGVIRLVPLDGRLAVVSNPSGATVSVDGVFRGIAPLEIALAPGAAYEVTVSMAGRSSFKTGIEIFSGRRSEVRAELEMLSGEVSVTSLPPGAQLLIDGAPAGTTGQTLELEARPYEIEVRLEGYVPYRTTLTPEPGLPQAVHAVLKESGPAGLAATVTTPQGVELVLVAPGRFTMGAPRREPGRRANEVLHEVELTRPFYLAVREVTNMEFREFRPGHRSGSVGSFNLEIDHHPVVNITWNDAAKYCNWLSERAGLPPVYVERSGRMVARSPIPRGFRLPTEAEWAWAARYPDSGSARKYAWGDTLPIPPEAGNYGDLAGAGVLKGALQGYTDNHGATAPVGSFQANPLGFFNLGGNVSEWMHDVYAVTPFPPGEVTRDPLGPAEGAYHVIRGSSWMDTNMTELRLSYRDYGDTARPDLGFRIARSTE